MSTDSPAASSTSATAFSNDAKNSASRSAPRRRLNSGTRQPTSSTAAYRERDGTTAPAVPRRAPSVPEPAEVMWHNRAVLTSMTGFGRKAQKWDSLDPNLKSYAHMAVAALVGCTWCLDFGYFHAHDEGLGMNGTRVRAPPQPALHRGLRDARLRLRRRGRRPEDVAAVGDVDQAAVRDRRAYLVRIVTRRALNRLRTLARRREKYVGEWLPEPLLTSPDVAADVELAERISIAMLTVLEAPYDEIAEAGGKSPAAVARSPTSPPTSSPSRTARGWWLPIVARSRVRNGSPASSWRCRRSRLRGDGRLAQRVPRRPDRRRGSGQDCHEPCRRERADHAHLRHPEPAQVGPARRGRRART
jgi:hypothetical protein